MQRMALSSSPVRRRCQGSCKSCSDSLVTLVRSWSTQGSPNLVTNNSECEIPLGKQSGCRNRSLGFFCVPDLSRVLQLLICCPCKSFEILRWHLLLTEASSSFGRHQPHWTERQKPTKTSTAESLPSFIP